MTFEKASQELAKLKGARDGKRADIQEREAEIAVLDAQIGALEKLAAANAPAPEKAEKQPAGK